MKKIINYIASVFMIVLIGFGMSFYNSVTTFTNYIQLHCVDQIIKSISESLLFFVYIVAALHILIIIFYITQKKFFNGSQHVVSHAICLLSLIGIVGLVPVLLEHINSQRVIDKKIQTSTEKNIVTTLLKLEKYCNNDKVLHKSQFCTDVYRFIDVKKHGFDKREWMEQRPFLYDKYNISKLCSNRYIRLSCVIDENKLGDDAISSCICSTFMQFDDYFNIVSDIECSDYDVYCKEHEFFCAMVSLLKGMAVHILIFSLALNISKITAEKLKLFL
ncbi:MAG: hypothetical protein AB7D37_03790 [Desulfovibrio sp.]